MFKLNRYSMEDLEAALVANNLAKVKAIIKSGFDLSMWDGYPLNCAICRPEKGNPDVVRAMVMAGADPNQSGSGRDPALFYAVRQEDVDMINVLVQLGAHLNMDSSEAELAKWKDCNKPIHAACQGNPKSLDALIQLGADVNSRGNRGRTCLFIASSRGHLDMIKTLAANGAEVNARDDDGFIPLHVAASEGKVNIIRALVELGAEVNATSTRGYTPLFCACERNETKTVRVLLDLGADPRVENENGESARDWAEKNGKDGLLKVFEEGEKQAREIALSKKMQAMKVNESTRNDQSNHVFISYCRADKEIVYPIVDQLVRDGYPIWIDKDQMEGSVLASMGDNIDRASLVLIFISDPYKKSINCEKEASYADVRKKLIIPVLVQRGYTPEGWLGIIIAAKMFYDFSGKYKFEDKYRELRKAIDGDLKRSLGSRK